MIIGAWYLDSDEVDIPPSKSITLAFQICSYLSKHLQSLKYNERS